MDRCNNGEGSVSDWESRGKGRQLATSELKIKKLLNKKKVFLKIHYCQKLFCFIDHNTEYAHELSTNKYTNGCIFNYFPLPITTQSILTSYQQISTQMGAYLIIFSY